jgi:hypothetical protein
MRTKTWTLFALLAAVLAITSAQPTSIHKSTTPEVHFDASVPRDRQIQLALSAAPPEIASKATVYILGPKGYEKAREGTNGVSCLVERTFAGTVQTSVGPMCYDAEGSRTLLLVLLFTEEMRAQGKSEEQIKADIATGYKEGRFKAPSKPGVCYMLSSENYLYNPETKKSGPFPGHLMFYAPYMTAKDFGYSAVSSSMQPYLVEPGKPNAMLVVVPAP